jgi:hypothetical protein
VLAIHPSETIWEMSRPHEEDAAPSPSSVVTSDAELDALDEVLDRLVTTAVALSRVDRGG